MKRAFNHEGLDVYRDALAFAASAERCIVEWDRKHSICDHLPRAAASIVENIAMASAAYSGMKVKALDYALGSTLECAACLDIATVKGLLGSQATRGHKTSLLRLFRMLMSLKHAWQPVLVRESRSEYGAVSYSPADRGEHEPDLEAFSHERLDAYKVAIEIVTSFSALAVSVNLSAQAFRRLDQLLTGIVLNIAEGNGRCSDTDQRRFLGVAHESAVKMAAHLDLCVVQKDLPREEVEKAKVLLARVASMTARMVGGDEYGDRQGSRQSSRQGLNAVEHGVVIS